jgi:hypothetical protein
MRLGRGPASLLERRGLPRHGLGSLLSRGQRVGDANLSQAAGVPGEELCYKCHVPCLQVSWTGGEVPLTVNNYTTASGTSRDRGPLIQHVPAQQDPSASVFGGWPRPRYQLSTRYLVEATAGKRQRAVTSRRWIVGGGAGEQMLYHCSSPGPQAGRSRHSNIRIRRAASVKGPGVASRRKHVVAHGDSRCRCTADSGRDAGPGMRSNLDDGGGGGKDWRRCLSV